MQDVRISAFGLSKLLSQWLKDPLCRATEREIRARLARGQRPETALSTPSTGRYSSKYKGVTWDERTQRWKAQIKHAGKVISLGRHPSEMEAALAYDAKCRELRGLDAETNFE